MTKDCQREIGIDLIKVWAIIGVVIIHTCNYLAPVNSSDFVSSLFWGSLTRASVPLFLMASGGIMLAREYTLKKLFSKNLVRIIFAMLFWSVLYKLFHLLCDGNLSAESIIHSVKEVLLFNQEFHFYYLHIIIIVYLFLPITSVFVKNATKKQLEYMLAVWFLLGIVYPTITAYRPFNLLGSITNLWSINLVYSSVGYGVLGYYIRRYNVFKKIDILLCTIGFLLTFCGTYLISLKQGFLYEHLLEGTSVGVCVLAVGAFSFLNRISIKNNKLSNGIVWVSKGSFLIYLVHIFFLEGLKFIGFTVDILPFIVSIPLVAFVIILLSLLVYSVISKIPFLNKWII